MNELTIINQEGKLLADSREVAEMVGKEHSNLMRDIRGYEKVVSENSNLNSQDFFIKDTYKVEGNNKTYDCYLLTKKGCDMVANKMTGEKGILFTAEYVTKFEEMEKQINTQSLNTSELSPELQMFNQMFKALANNELEQKQIKQEIKETKEEIQGIREVVAINSSDWKEDCRKLITKIAYQLGGIGHINDVYKEVYSALDRRLGTNLQTRLTNKRRRMADEGVCKSKRDKLNYINVIEDDKKLIEGYVAIVKELAIKNGI